MLGMLSTELFMLVYDITLKFKNAFVNAEINMN